MMYYRRLNITVFIEEKNMDEVFKGYAYFYLFKNIKTIK